MTLGQICDESGGGLQTGPFGSQLHASDYADNGVPNVMPQNIGDNRINSEGIARVPESDMSRLQKYWLQTGDIIYSRRGDVERRALVRDENEGWLCGTGCLRVRIADKSIHDPAFVSYALGLPESRAWIVRHAVGATMLNLNTSILAEVPLRLPRIAEQRAIAEVLGALDDKIAANGRILAIADDLVRARFASLSGDPIRLDEIATNVRQQVQPSAVDPESVYVGLEHIQRRLMWLTGFAAASTVTSGKSEFLEGDILFGKLRPYFHKVVRAPLAGICSTDVLVVRAKVPSLAGFVLACASADDAVRETSAAAEGTRMPRTQWADLGAVSVPWPGDQAAHEFSADVSQVGALAGQLVDESRHLAVTRDELLPLLMSGKISVRDAEREAEEVL
jgi:type I restriction enzyme S subunit